MGIGIRIWMPQWIQILDYADSYAYFLMTMQRVSLPNSRPPGEVMKFTYSMKDSLSGTGSKIISFYAVREGLVPWDWLFLVKVK